MTERSDELKALNDLGAQFRDLGDVQPRDLLTRGRLLTILVLVAALAALAFTSPGRVVAEHIGGLVGIGEPATLPPEDLGSHLIDRGGAVVIAGGLAPDGTAYEIVANRSVTNESVLMPEPGAAATAPVPRPGEPGTRQPGEGASDAINSVRTVSDGPVTCVTVDLPDAPNAQTVEFCEGQDDQGLLGETGVLDGVNYLDRSADRMTSDQAGSEARYLVTAELSPDITRVDVTYETEEGIRHDAYSDIGIVDAEIAELIGTDDRMGWLVAFLPDDGLPPAFTGRGHRHDPGTLGTVELVGYNENGEVVARDNFGDQFSQRLEAENHRIEGEEKAIAAVLDAAANGALTETLCFDSLRAGLRGEARDLCFDLFKGLDLAD